METKAKVGNKRKSAIVLISGAPKAENNTETDRTKTDFKQRVIYLILGIRARCLGRNNRDSLIKYRFGGEIRALLAGTFTLNGAQYTYTLKVQGVWYI